jgi:hypothetical protein
MSKVQEAVSALLDEAYLKESVIQAKIKLLEDQAVVKQATINRMTRLQIDLELADDTTAHSASAQQISQERENLADLLGRIAAYREALIDSHSGVIVDKLPELLRLENEQNEAHRESFAIKLSKMEEKKSQLNTLRLEIQALQTEINNDAQYRSSKDLAPILRHLGPRLAKEHEGNELTPLGRLVRGESLESLLNPPKPVRDIPYQGPTTTVNYTNDGPNQSTGRQGHINNLQTGESWSI